MGEGNVAWPVTNAYLGMESVRSPFLILYKRSKVSAKL